MYGSNLYGQGVYGQNNASESDKEDRYIDLLMYLPSFYHEIKEMKELQTILGFEVGELKYSLEDLISQCFISSATWGLDRWEKVFGIQTDRSKSFERRREILLAKLRGSGTTTKEMIKNVAIAFSGGEVAVQEYPREHKFVIQFIGVKGIPQNMAGLKNAIDEIKPAHLSFDFKYTYTVWSQIDMSWEQAGQGTWGNLRTYEGE